MYWVEKSWEHKNLSCVVVMIDMGHRCGYVGVPHNHPLYGENYSSSPDYIQELGEALEHSLIGKRGIMTVITFRCNGKIRVNDLFDVHGSLTYSGGRGYPIELGEWVTHGRSGASHYYPTWWFGYDCGHAGDGKDLSVVSEAVREIEMKYPNPDPVRSLDYCISECESLAEQLSEI